MTGKNIIRFAMTFFAVLAFLGGNIFFASLRAADVPISLFKLQDYDQNVNDWLSPSSPDYNKALVKPAYQRARLKEYYQHTFSTKAGDPSPWSGDYIEKIFHQPQSLKTIESDIVKWFDNHGKNANYVGYGENFRPYDTELPLGKPWIGAIRDNMNLSRLADLQYKPENRAIAVTNLEARILPTQDVNFYHFTLAGQGYPFDNLQMSALWAGTPVYIVSQAKDRAWDLVVTPSFIAWVKSNGIAQVNKQFITTWQESAKKHIAAITKTKTPIIDNQNNVFRFNVYVGAVFPASDFNRQFVTILIPVADMRHHAAVQKAIVSASNIAVMPLPATAHNFSKILSALIGRPYGWGGMYFYNDCSQEMKSVYTPFGIWLPRHSSEQVLAGKLDDQSGLDLNQRLQYLNDHGHKMMTIIYIGGHIIMYLGSYANPYSKNSVKMAMSYQNLWGMRPIFGKDARVIVGQSVLFPLLEKYPEDSNLASLAGNKYFQISYLDEWPTKLLSAQPINLKALAYPVGME